MELVRFPLYRGFSVRSILTFALAVIIAALLWATLGSHTASAADASWTSDTILHDQHVYKKVDAAQTPQGIPSSSTVYAYHPVATSSDTSADKEAFFIYFASGVDPPTATSAQYVAYDYNPSTKSYSNEHNKKTISISPMGEEDSYSSCSVSGIGWIVCPVTVFLAESMDFLFDLIANFLTVQPLLSTSDNGLYTAWSVMRTIANIAFVIAFLVIIYSQLTSFGVSNYGIKRLLPRLILAAIFVNLSFIISALAVDASNILGHSIQEVFEQIRKDVFNINADTWGEGLNSGWTTLTTAVLAGGGAVVGSMYVISSGAYMLLIPIILLLALTLLLVLVILAARQAIIIILVVISPLAFVANLLPNTEKWFGKWRDLFMTMLIFFPAFSLAFGGAQLAGQIIIMNAGDNIITLIFGMAVQVAPLVITPLLLKLSGGLLGRIAQIANNPAKGALDRNRKWAQDMAERKRLGTVGKDLSGKSKLNPTTYGARMVKGNEFRRRNLAKQIEVNKNLADTRYLETGKATDLHEQMHEAETGKHIVETLHKTHLQHKINDVGSDLHVQNVKFEDAKLAGEVEQARTTRMNEEYKSGRLVATGELSTYMQNLKESTTRLSAEKQGAASAQYEVQRNVSSAIDADTVAGDALRKVAASVAGDAGEVRARASAVTTLNSLDTDALNNNVKLLRARAQEAGSTIKQYSRGLVEAVEGGQTSYMGSAISKETVRAALQAQAEEKNMSLFESVLGSTHFDQSMVREIIANNNGNFKVAGGFHMQDDPTLNIEYYTQQYGAARAKAEFTKVMARKRIESLGNVGAANIANVKAGWLADFAQPANLQANIKAAKDANMYDDLLKAYMNVKNALSNEDVLSQIGDRETEVRNIEAALAQVFNTPATSDPRPKAPTP